MAQEESIRDRLLRLKNAENDNSVISSEETIQPKDAAGKISVSDRLNAAAGLKKKDSKSSGSVFNSPAEKVTSPSNSLSPESIIGDLSKEYFDQVGAIPPADKVAKFNELVAAGKDPLESGAAVGLEMVQYEQDGKGYVKPKISLEDISLGKSAIEFAKSKYKGALRDRYNASLQSLKAEYANSEKSMEDFKAFRNGVTALGVDRMKAEIPELIGENPTAKPKSKDEVIKDFDTLYDTYVGGWDSVNPKEKPKKGSVVYMGTTGSTEVVVDPRGTIYSKGIVEAEKTARIGLSFWENAKANFTGVHSEELDDLTYKHELINMSRGFLNDAKKFKGLVEGSFGGATAHGFEEYLTKYKKSLESLFNRDSFLSFQKKFTDIAEGQASFEDLNDEELMLFQSMRASADLTQALAKDMPLANEIGSAIGRSLGFMLEMFATGGVGAGAGKAAGAAVVSKLAPGVLLPSLSVKMAGQAASSLTRVAASTTFMPSTWMGAAEKYGEGMDLPSAWVSSYKDTYLEVMSERLFVTPMSKFAKGSAVSTFWNRTGSAFGKIKGVKSAVSAIFEQGVEEYVPLVAHGWAEGDGFFDFTKVGEAMQDVRQQKVLWGSVAVMGLAGAGVNKVSKLNVQRKYRNLGNALGAVRGDIDEILKTEDINFEEVYSAMDNAIDDYAAENKITDKNLINGLKNTAFAYSSYHFGIEAWEPNAPDRNSPSLIDNKFTKMYVPKEEDTVIKGDGYEIVKTKNNESYLTFTGSLNDRLNKFHKGETMTEEEILDLRDDLKEIEQKDPGNAYVKEITEALDDIVNDARSTDDMRAEISNKPKITMSNRKAVVPVLDSKQKTMDVSIGGDLTGRIEHTNKDGIDTYKVYDTEDNEKGSFESGEAAFGWLTENKAKVTAAPLATRFAEKLESLKKTDPDTYWSVDVPSRESIVEAAENNRLIDTGSIRGIVTQDGNIEGLHKYAKGSSGGAQAALAEAVKKGGTKLDAFEGYLTDIYLKAGFRVAARTPFNKEEAPDDMPEAEKDKAPMVNVMFYDPNNEIDFKDEVYDTYEDAIAFRDLVLEDHELKKTQVDDTGNRSGDTQDFFSDVVSGTSEKFVPKKPWEPLLKMTKGVERVKKVYDSFVGNFDNHIATSIPGFRDVQLRVIDAVDKLFGEHGGVVYDIGGSEGGFGKTITSLSDGRVKSINVDINEDMEKSFNDSPVEGSTFVKEAFGEEVTIDGKTYPKHKPTEKADVVHESMTFQFITDERKGFVDEVADNYIKDDGIFVTEEKFSAENREQGLANERKKDSDFKSKYYDSAQITKKQEEILVGMAEDQSTKSKYINNLKSRFKYVYEYWDSGNFKGIVASNNRKKARDFVKAVGNTDTEFSEKNINPKNDQANDMLAEGFSDLAAAIGGLKSVVGEVDPKVSDAVVKIAKGLALKLNVAGSELIREVKKMLASKGFDIKGSIVNRIMKENKAEFEALTNTSPEAKRILRGHKTPIFVGEISDLKSKIDEEVSKAKRKGNAHHKKLLKEVASTIKDMVKKGSISTKQASSIMTRATSLNFNNVIAVQDFLVDVENTMNNADYLDNLSKAKKMKATVRKMRKGQPAAVVELADRLAKVNPSLIEDFDSFFENIGAMIAGMRKTMGSKDGIKVREAMNEFAVGEYINGERIRQKPILDKLAEEAALNAVGNEVGEEKLSEKEIEDKRMSELKDSMDSVLGDIKSVLRTGKLTGGSEAYLSEEQKDIAKDFSEIDVDLMPYKMAIEMLDQANHFVKNGTTDGMGASIKYYQGMVNAKAAASMGLTAKKFKAMGFANDWYGEQIASHPLFFENIFRGRNRANQAVKLMGMRQVWNGYSEAIATSNRIVNAYSNRFKKQRPNGKNFMAAENIVERAVLGYVQRSAYGTDSDMAEEFNIRKQRLIDSKNKLLKGDKIQKRLGGVYNTVINKVLADAESAADVRAAVDGINSKAVDHWTDVWKSILGDLSEVSRNVYNQIISPDMNYNPDIYRFIDPGLEPKLSLDESLASSSYGYSTKNIYKEESSVLKGKKKFEELPPDKYVSLDFDKNMASTLQAALTDIKTAAATRQVQGFVNSKEFKEIFPDGMTRNVVVNKITSMINDMRGRFTPDNATLRKVNSNISALSTFAAQRALGSMTQAVKQTVPVAINTLINAGGLDLSVLTDPFQMRIVNESGRAIAVRGAEALGAVDALDKVTPGSLATSGGWNALKKAQNVWIDNFLVKPDVYIAKASWMTYYKKALKQSGVDVKNIVWSKHQIDNKAADYAQDMVDRQQNTSEAVLLGEFLKSKNPLTSLTRKLLFPFANFALNQKVRMYTDATVLTSDLSSTEEKLSALKSLGGMLSEQVAFHTMGYFIGTIMHSLANMVLGIDETDDDRQKRLDRYANRSFGYVFLDIVSPLPVFDDLIISTGNSILSWAASDRAKEELSLNIMSYIKATDALGMIGVAIDKTTEGIKAFDLAFGETYTSSYMGHTTRKKLYDEDKEAAKLSAYAYGLYLLGLLPAEVGRLSSSIRSSLERQGISESKYNKAQEKIQSGIGGGRTGGVPVTRRELGVKWKGRGFDPTKRANP